MFWQYSLFGTQLYYAHHWLDYEDAFWHVKLVSREADIKWLSFHLQQHKLWRQVYMECRFHACWRAKLLRRELLPPWRRLSFCQVLLANWIFSAPMAILERKETFFKKESWRFSERWTSELLITKLLFYWSSVHLNFWPTDLLTNDLQGNLT